MKLAALLLVAALALAACGDDAAQDVGAATATATASTSGDTATAAAADPATTDDPGPNPIDAVAEDDAAAYVVAPWSDEEYEATDLRFLPDGRALVITKGGWGGPGTGRVALLDADGSFVRDLLALPVCTDAERGLIGLEIDPDFAETGRILLAYTRQMSGCALTDAATLAGDADAPVAAPVWNRVSSFAFDEDGIDPASEEVILDELPGHQSAHNGGGLALMPDGTLLVAVGEGTYALARDLDVPTGKILRVDIGPEGPRPASDNPYAGAKSSDAKPYVFASGLRNPFRIAVEPETGEVAAADVGTDDWEEVDLVEPGGDYGYPDIEGSGSAGGSLEPAFAYRHEGGCNSVIGGAWLPASFVAGAKRSVYVFSDLGCPGVWALEPGTDAPRVVRIAAPLATSAASLVRGPDGAVYYVAIGPGPSSISRIARAA